MNLEEKRIGQFAHIVEASLGAKLVPLRDASLSQSYHNASHKSQEDKRCARHDDFVAEHISGHPVGKRTLARRDGEALQMASNVFGKLICGDVAVARLLAQRLQHDAVQIAHHPPT
jgi:hypothetical protein